MARSSGPNPIDVHVGKRLRLRRTLRGLSQQRLGERMGLTFQQVQKYERGANRIGSSRLYELAQILEVPVSYFFEEIATEAGALAEEPAPYAAEQINRRETLELVRAYYAIPDPEVRKRVFDLVKSLSD